MKQWTGNWPKFKKKSLCQRGYKERGHCEEKKNNNKPHVKEMDPLEISFFDELVGEICICCGNKDGTYHRLTYEIQRHFRI
jgi:hypothetical protein